MTVSSYPTFYQFGRYNGGQNSVQCLGTLRNNACAGQQQSNPGESGRDYQGICSISVVSVVPVWLVGNVGP